jgi:hypothetical protein
MEMEMKILAWTGLLSKNSPTSSDDLVFDVVQDGFTGGW